MMMGDTLPAIDVMVPVAAKDIASLPACLTGLVTHCRNAIRAIYVIGARAIARRVTCDVAVHWIDEESVWPSKHVIEDELKSTSCQHDNASWYFQQLLKLHCFQTLPPAGDHVVVLDADFALVDDMEFVDAGGRALLARGYPLQWRLHTRDHVLPSRHSALLSARRLVPGWKPVDPYSGMQHHMVFDRFILGDLIQRAEVHHARPFWKAFLSTVEAGRWTGASEYVLYRHFALASFLERVRTRHVSGIDVIQAAESATWTLADVIRAPRRRGIQAVGCHSFLGYQTRLATMDYIPDPLRAQLRGKGPLMLWLDRGLLRVAAAEPPLSLRIPSGRRSRWFF